MSKSFSSVKAQIADVLAGSVVFQKLSKEGSANVGYIHIELQFLWIVVNVSPSLGLAVIQQVIPSNLSFAVICRFQ